MWGVAFTASVVFLFLFIFWKEWAFTDGSCLTSVENGSQSIGAGVYHPQFKKITTINLGGTS
jgi:hypothetical protein